jgi:hypothetical protein
MLVGEFKGEKVRDAEPKVRASIIDAGLAFPYAEPEGLVISRSADECVVLLDGSVVHRLRRAFVESLDPKVGYLTFYLPLDCSDSLLTRLTAKMNN